MPRQGSVSNKNTRILSAEKIPVLTFNGFNGIKLDFFKIRLDMEIMLNLLLPLSTDYLKRTDRDILQKIASEMDDTYELARKKAVRQLQNKEGARDAVC